MTAAVEGGVFGFVQLIGLDPAGDILRNSVDGYVNSFTNTPDPPTDDVWATLPGNLHPANSGF